MKDGMSSFDIAAMVKELQCLVGGRVDKAYQMDRNRILLRIRVPEEGRKDLLIVVGKWIYLTKKTEDAPRTPTSFAMLLRKYLNNGKINGIEQLGFDRIVNIHVEKADSYVLVCEMFREGNVVLVSGGEIIQPLIPKSWRQREIRAHRKYIPPPARKDPRILSNEDIFEILNSSKKDLVRTLAVGVNLGGQYAEEVCLQSGMDKTQKAKELKEEETARIHQSMVDLFKSIEEADGGILVRKDDVVIDVAPFQLQLYEGLDVKVTGTFSRAIDEFLETEAKEPLDTEYEEIKGKYERQLLQQEKAVKNLEKRIDEYTMKAELIYVHYMDCERIIDLVKEEVKEQNVGELVKDLKKIPSFKDLDPERGTVTLSLKDEDGELHHVELDFKSSVNENAGSYYERAKRARDKLAGAENSLGETRCKLAGVGKDLKVKKKEAKKRAKRFWFESYRWFISSDGNIVIAGRDAKTNDKVVKKYLKDRDRYAHAEVHGAPSVVIKNKNGEVSERTLKEACEFALNFSKAWSSKIGSGTAYWVLPDQVSKAPVSGEFLPRGAFMVRGRRNFVPNLKLRLGVGKLEYEGVEKVMCGPLSAVESRCERFLIFEPGEMRKSTFIKKLMKVFKVEQEELARILPPGGVNIVKTVGFSKEML